MDSLSQARADEEEARKRAPPQAGSAAGEKLFLLNPVSRKIHIVRAGAVRALCKGYGLQSSAARANPELQGKAWQGKDCTPCDSCRGSAARLGLFRGLRQKASEESSSSAASSDPE